MMQRFFLKKAIELDSNNIYAQRLLHCVSDFIQKYNSDECYYRTIFDNYYSDFSDED